MTLYEKSQEALDDWQAIVEYSLDRHGENQTIKYTRQLINCIEAMAKGDGYFKDVKVKKRTIRIKHCQKHYIFGFVRDKDPLMIIALFHESMDLMTRLKKRLS